MRHTRITTALFDWSPFVAMSPVARCLWVGLYCSPEAKRMLPGLFQGGIGTIAEAARLTAQDTTHALRELEDRHLIVRDKRFRLLRFAALPDRGERPSNGSVLKMWWGRWSQVPECPVRQDWVELLAWLCEPQTRDHHRVWSTTFGTVRSAEIAGGRSPQPSPDSQLAMFSATSDTVSDTVSDTTKVEGRRKEVGGGVGEEEAAVASPTLPRPSGPSVEALELAVYLAQAIQSHTPAFAPETRKLQGWATWLDRSLAKGRAAADLRGIIDFCHRNDQDTFWRPNLLSGRKLHAKFDELMVRRNTRGAAPLSAVRSNVRTGRVEPLPPEEYGAPGVVEDF